MEATAARVEPAIHEILRRARRIRERIWAVEGELEGFLERTTGWSLIPSDEPVPDLTEAEEGGWVQAIQANQDHTIRALDRLDVLLAELEKLG